MKKENTVKVSLNNPVTIDGRRITEIHFDLLHIQQGWDSVNRDYNAGPARNSFTQEDVVAFFEQLNVLLAGPVQQTASKASVEKRFAFNVYDNDKKLKMVVDLMKNSSTIVVTIH